MYTDSIEQLRGTAGKRQVTVRAETALAAFTTPPTAAGSCSASTRVVVSQSFAKQPSSRGARQGAVTKETAGCARRTPPFTKVCRFTRSWIASSHWIPRNDRRHWSFANGCCCSRYVWADCMVGGAVLRSTLPFAPHRAGFGHRRGRRLRSGGAHGRRHHRQGKTAAAAGLRGKQAGRRRRGGANLCRSQARRSLTSSCRRR